MFGFFPDQGHLLDGQRQIVRADRRALLPVRVEVDAPPAVRAADDGDRAAGDGAAHMAGQQVVAVVVPPRNGAETMIRER
jgi:hypothetical protein